MTDNTEISAQLHNHRLNNAPPSLYFIPEFVTPDEEKALCASVNNAPLPKWRQLNGRRVQNWGGVVGKKHLVPCDDIPKWLHAIMNRLVERGIFDPANRPNHVLVNEYLPGQGIMPHTDGPAFHPVVATLSLGEHTVMDFRPRRPGSPENGQRNGVESSESPNNTNGGIKGSVFLPRRSLIILADTCYSDLMHGIQDRNSETLAKCQLWNWDEILQLDLVNVVRGSDGCECIKVDRVNTRYSLTVRNVPKVVKLFG